MSPPRPSERALNPAHAILAGAILSAVVTLVGVTLNIRSSERLSSEREKRDAAVAEANDLKDKVGQLEQKLNEAVAKIPPSSSEPTIAVTTLVPPPPQSIVVVITVPTPAVTAPVGALAPTTRPAPSTTARVATSTPEQGSTTTSASSTTSSTSSTTTTTA